MSKFMMFAAWVFSVGIVGVGSAILVVRANNSALPGTAVAKLLKRGA